MLELGAWTRATKPFLYEPKAGKVAQLPLATPGKLDAPDNITVGPDGRLYLFEDGSGGNNIVTFKVDPVLVGVGLGYRF